MSRGGAGLVGYSDSSGEEGGEEKVEEEEEDSEEEKSPPRKKQRRGGKQNSLTITMATPHPVLPLPTAIMDMFNEEDSSSGASEDLHEGRVRSFPHVRGNWATFVFIPIDVNAELESCITGLHTYLQTTFAPCVGSPQFHVMPLSDLHVSLSRTVTIRHHWIDPLMEALRNKIRRRERFTLGFSSLTFYCNDEKTRSFVGLEVSLGHSQACSLVQDVDECFAKFNLQGFYKELSFHMSIFWCLENIRPKVTAEDRICLQDHWQSLLLKNNFLNGCSYNVTEIRCKTGNKFFSFPLAS